MTVDQAIEQALTHHQSGRFVQAEAIYHQILAVEPNHARTIHLLGALTGQTGHPEAAVDLIRKAIAINPADPYFHNNLGKFLIDLGRSDEGIAACLESVRLASGFADGWHNLGNGLAQKGLVDASLNAWKKAVELNPTFADAYNNPGNALREKSDLDEALVWYKKGLALNPNLAWVHSNLVYAMHFHPGCDARAIAAEAALWNQRHASPLSAAWKPHRNPRDPERRLKIGYVSPDFKQQAECFFVLPLLQAHDRTRVEVHCYSSVPRADHVTQRMRAAADVWHDVAAFTDDALDEKIRADGIDILIDLTMQMAGNRLLLFARKPAPVQVSWLAYPGTTGLAAIDARISDLWIDPPGIDETVYAEQTLRLPDCWCCYHPLFDSPAVGPLPAIAAGHITLGSLNNFSKMNDRVWQLWARVMQAVPNSRLLLLAPEGEHRARRTALFATLGVGPTRLEWITPRKRFDYLELYNRIDIALDPFPYNGITTTCDALWMGVPVVTPIGQRASARASLSLLATVGLPDLACDTDDAYIQKVCSLATDLPQLAGLRAGLREKMEQSPLMNARQFARHMEDAYRLLWKKWIAKGV